MAEDYYKILGVAKGASEDEIKAAYKKLAMQYHPDRHSGKADAEKKVAEEKMKQVNRAFDVLGDKQKKAQYDQFGDEDGNPFGGGGGFWRSAGAGGGMGGMGGFGDDLFSNIFSAFTGAQTSRRPRMEVDGEDIQINLTLTFKEAAFGCTKELPINRIEACGDCKGSGAKSANSVKSCTKCGGSGAMRQTVNTPFGQMATTKTCDTCQGRGKVITDPCKGCNGAGRVKKVRTINVSVPAGIDSGQIMTYFNQGNAGTNGGKSGSVIVIINVRPHSLFVRKGADLYMDLPITITQAALGCKVSIPTLDASVSYSIPEGTQNGQQFRIKGYGVKQFKREARGDIYVRVLVEVPRNLSSKTKEALKSFDSMATQNNYPTQKDFLSKIKEV